MMQPQEPSLLPKARILGKGAIVTLEDLYDGSRLRVRVAHREENLLHLEPLAEAGMVPTWHAGSVLQVRVARPFGLFCFRGTVEGQDGEGHGLLKLDPAPPQRRQLRGYFRMQVRLGIHLIPTDPESEDHPVVLRACNLSGSGALVFDPDGHLALNEVVRVGLPVRPGGARLRVKARVVRLQEKPARAALYFEGINENARQHLLRFLFREHRRRIRVRRGAQTSTARIVPLERP